MKITLNEIREFAPCCSGWQKLLKSQGKTKADDVPFEASTIVDSNGIDDTLWLIGKLGKAELCQRFALWCARQVQHRMTDERSIRALNVAEAYLDGKVTKKELAAAAAAVDAAYDAVGAAAAAYEAAYYAAAAVDARADARQAQKAKLKAMIDAE